MQKKRFLTNENGFTVAELLIVILILAILSAILFPVFTKAKVVAKQSTTLSNISQIGKAISLYNSDADGVYPRACSAREKFSQCGGTIRKECELLNQVVSPYTVNAEIWKDFGDTGIPRLSALLYTEPIECDLPGTYPSMFQQYGSSFDYRRDLGELKISEPFELISEDNQTISQSETAILQSAYGNWHGGPEENSKRVVALFGDLHCKMSNAHSLLQQTGYIPRIAQ